MLTAEQHAVRRTGVGASEVAAALGLSPYMTPLELYRLKRAEIPPTEETLPMRYGNWVEPFVLREFMTNHPELQLVVSPDTMRRGAMLAHLDALAPGQCNVQIKTARSRKEWGESGSPDIPAHYIVQVQAEMLIARVSVSYIPTLFAGADYDEFIVEADHELQEMIEARVNTFWRRVLDGTPPDPVSDSDVRQLYPRDNGRTVELNANDAESVQELRSARDEYKVLAERIDALETALKLVMGPAAAATFGGKVIATWKASRDSQRFDLPTYLAALNPGALPAEIAELAADVERSYTVTRPGSRRLLLK